MGDDFTAGFGTHTQEPTWASQCRTQLKPDLTRLGNHSIYWMCYQHPSDNTRSPRLAGGEGAHSSQLPRKGRKIFSLFTAIALRLAGPGAPRLLLGFIGKFHLAMLFLKALALFTLKTRVKAQQNGMGAGTAPALPQEGAWKPKYSGEGFLWIYLEDNPKPTKSMSSPPAGAGLCPAQSPDWFPQLGLLGAAVRRLCPMPRSRQSSELGKKATDPKDGSRTRGSGAAPQGHGLEGSEWDHGQAPKVPTEAKHFHGFCLCMSRQSHFWVETPTFGRFSLSPVPVGIQGWGSTHRSSPTRDGTFPESWVQGRQPLSSKSTDNREQTTPKLRIPREWRVGKHRAPKRGGTEGGKAPSSKLGEERQQAPNWGELGVQKHRAPNWRRSEGRQTRSEFGENREWATNELQTGRKLEADKFRFLSWGKPRVDNSNP